MVFQDEGIREMAKGTFFFFSLATLMRLQTIRALYVCLRTPQLTFAVASCDSHLQIYEMRLLCFSSFFLLLLLDFVVAVAHEVNTSVENIGARRLHTVVEK